MVELELESITGKSIKNSIKNSVPIAVGTGLVALDVVFGRENKGRMWAGGSCGNVLTILRYLGWHSYPIANLKNDEAARIICKDLSYWDVNLDFIICNEKGKTPIIIEKIGKNGRHKFMFKCPFTGSDLPKYKPIDIEQAKRVISQMMDRPSVFYFDRVSKAALQLAREFAKQGAVIVFEPSTIKNERLFYEALELCHILKYSGQQLRILRKMNPRPIPFLEIETLGSRGLRYRMRTDSEVSQWKFMRAYKLDNIVDTAGAGDWCTAGILHILCRRGIESFKKLLSTEHLEFGLRFGQALAAFNCMFEGARGSMYYIERNVFLDILSEITLEDVLNIVKDAERNVNNKNNFDLFTYKNIEYLIRPI